MVQNLAIAIPSISMDAISMDSSAFDESGATHSIFAEIPLTALSKNTKRQLSHLLNSKKILRSEEGYERDWRGIAALAQLKSLCDENTIVGDDPMIKVLQMWCCNNPKTATFVHLEQFLGIIDRWDVCDDIYENLVEDVKNYNEKQQQKSFASSDERDSLVKSNATDDFGLGSDPNILTKDDVLRAQNGLPPQKYDAFVLFADADINYAVEMITKLEENTNNNNFKLCLKDRDLLAGISFAHVALTQLIEERCKHLIVILTDEFMKSPENKFLVNYAQVVQIQANTRKIIPLLYEDSVVIPSTLKIYTPLKYNPGKGNLINYWDKLASSIRNVSLPSEAAIINTKYTYNLSSANNQTDVPKYNLSNLPTPPTDIPSININGHALMLDDDIPKKKERNKFLKRSSLRNSGNSKLPISDGVAIRNAHSTSQLHGSYKDTNVSLSNLSTTSSSPSEIKKKMKWGKMLKKVFSRSTSKLQEPA